MDVNNFLHLFDWGTVITIGTGMALIYGMLKNINKGLIVDIQKDINSVRAELKEDMNKFESRWLEMDRRWADLLGKFYTLDKDIEKLKTPNKTYKEDIIKKKPGRPPKAA